MLGQTNHGRIQEEAVDGGGDKFLLVTALTTVAQAQAFGLGRDLGGKKKCIFALGGASRARAYGECCR